MKKTPANKNYIRYIPKLVKGKLDTITYNRIENLYCIIDIIYRRNIFFKSDAQKTYGYSGIPKQAFNELLGKHQNVVADINFLIELGIVERNEYYNPDAGKCKGYRIAKQYLSKNIGVEITAIAINRRIKKQISKMREWKEKQLEFQQSKYFKTFQIDKLAAITFLEAMSKNEIKALAKGLEQSVTDTNVQQVLHCEEGYKAIIDQFVATGNNEIYNILHRHILYTMQVNCIHDGYLYFKRNKTNGRLDTNLTSLPSVLRQFIKTDCTLFNIDLKSSQPFFLYTLLIGAAGVNPDEIIRYRDLVVNGVESGKGLYEYLAEEYLKTYFQFVSREQMKEIVCKIFYSKNQSYKTYKNFFKNLFPTINTWMEEQKILKHNALAIKLQSLESDIVLDAIMPILLDKDIVPYTIHDSFVCCDYEVPLIVDTIKEITVKKFGFSPNIHVDQINEATEDVIINKLEILPGLDK